MRKGWIVLSAAIALSGCAPIRPIVIDPEMISESTGRYPVTVERGRWVGLDTTPVGIYVDRKLVATVGGGQVVTMYVAEGRHSVGVGPAKGKPQVLEPMDEVAVDVSETSRPILHTNVSALGYNGWKIERVSK